VGSYTTFVFPLESVPNFSEGRRRETIDALAEALSSRARVLDVHSDPDHNRSVFTLVGGEDELAGSLLAGVERARELKAAPDSSDALAGRRIAIVDPTAEDIVRLRREAQDRVIAAGAEASSVFNRDSAFGAEEVGPWKFGATILAKLARRSYTTAGGTGDTLWIARRTKTCDACR